MFFPGSKKGQSSKKKNSSQRWFQLYLRAKSYRKALAWQKKYLTVVIQGYKDLLGISGSIYEHSDILKKQVALAPSSVGLAEPRRGKLRFRIIIRAVMAAIRMKFMVKRWSVKKQNPKVKSKCLVSSETATPLGTLTLRERTLTYSVSSKTSSSYASASATTFCESETETESESGSDSESEAFSDNSNNNNNNNENILEKKETVSIISTSTSNSDSPKSFFCPTPILSLSAPRTQSPPLEPSLGGNRNEQQRTFNSKIPLMDPQRLRALKKEYDISRQNDDMRRKWDTNNNNKMNRKNSGSTELLKSKGRISYMNNSGDLNGIEALEKDIEKLGFKRKKIDHRYEIYKVST